MTPKELDNLISAKNWKADIIDDNDCYLVPNKIRYALVASLQDDSLADPDRHDLPIWIHLAAQDKAKADTRTAHKYDPAPRNRTLSQLLKDYVTKGLKIKARAELKHRLPFLSFEEQRKVISALCENINQDRQFALRFLDEHWDDSYTPLVTQLWHDFHDQDAAKLIVHHFPQDFIRENRFELASGYNYLQVRLRLPANFSISREQLSDSAYLYLCARQSIEISDDEAESLFYQNVLNAIGYRYIKSSWTSTPNWSKHPQYFDDTLCNLSVVSSMVWSLGMLGKTDILMRFAEFNKTIVPLIHETKWQEIKDEFNRMGFTLDFSKYDESITIREQKESMLSNSHSYNVPSHFDFDSFVDEHVAMENNNG